MRADLIEQVAQAYALGEPASAPVAAAQGQQGRVWRLDTDRGTYAVKELLRRQTEPEAAASVALQEAALRGGELTLPRPVRTTSGMVLAEPGPHQVRVYEWVELLPPDRSADPAVIGATVAAAHRVRCEPALPLHPWYTEPVGETRWRELHRLALDAKAPFVEALAAEIPELLRLESVLEPPSSLWNCHRDLWADNVLPLRGGGICVIDWENCGLADPAYEVPMVLVDFALGDAHRLRSLYAAYIDAGGPGRLLGRGAFSMVIAQFGHFWESAVAAYVRAGATDEVRSHSIGRIDELLGAPVHVADIDDVLDAVAGIGRGSAGSEPALRGRA